jgi:hypothetical protein
VIRDYCPFMAITGTHTFRQLASLHIRSEFEYFLIGARRNGHTPTTVGPIMCVSEMGSEFIARYLKLEAAALAQHFSAYAMNHGGIPGDILTANSANGLRAHACSTGIIRALTADIHKGDKKAAIKSVVMPMLHRQYRKWQVFMVV